jgi:FixJ family two-component response regulator
MHNATLETDSLSKVLIAVVEDDRHLLVALESLLEAAGYEVLLYFSAEDFLVSDRLQDINCLISDIGLPGINGIELLRVVHASRPYLPVIIITAARCEPALLQAAMDAGARKTFVKPLDSAALLNAIAATQ